MNHLDYWERRKAQNIYDKMDEVDITFADIESAYHQAQQYLTRQANKVFDKFQRDYGLTEKEARDVLKFMKDEKSIKAMKKVLESRPRDPNIQRLLSDLDSAAYSFRIKRFENLQEQVEHLRQGLYQKEKEISDSFYPDLMKDSYYKSVFEVQKQAGFYYPFETLPEAEIQCLMTSKWYGADYSTRIWNNTGELAESLKNEFLVNLMTGRSNKDVIKLIEERFEAGIFASKRLIRTESAFFHGQMEALSYQEADIEKYRFVAVLDLRTSSICRDHDGEIYDVSDMKVGVNYPPMHSFCRSTTIASFDEDWLKSMQRRARDPKTGKNILIPGDMTYNDWYEKYVQGQPLEKASDKVYNRGMEGMLRKKVIDQNKMSIASKEQINRLSRKFRRRGGEFINDQDAIEYLDDKKAVAITLDAYTILMRKEISISALIEELEHAEQYLRGENDGTALSVAKNEINAKEKSISERERYRLPKIEVDSVRKDIKFYKKEIERLKNEDS